MAPLAAALAIAGIFTAMALLLCYVDGLKVFAPKSTDHLAGAAQGFCLDTCQHADGTCPLLASGMRSVDCPLWRFVRESLPTDLRVSPLRRVGPSSGALAA